jgi:small subunit ribosomal protein S14
MKHRRYRRDNKKRVLYKKTEIFQRLIKTTGLFKNSVDVKLVLHKRFLLSLVTDSFKVRSRNICVMSGRSRGVYKSLRVSRIVLKALGGTGLFFGLKKASW